MVANIFPGAVPVVDMFMSPFSFEGQTAVE